MCTSPVWTYKPSLLIFQTWKKKYCIIYAPSALIFSWWAQRPFFLTCFSHFSLWCKHQEWGRRVPWPLRPRASCIQAPDVIWVWFQSIVKSIHSLLGARGSVCWQNTGFPLHSVWACVAWQRLNIRVVGVISVKMQAVPDLTTLSWPNNVSHERNWPKKK